MPNRPEYLAVWLGLTRVGGVVALLNTNLTGAALAHCIDIVGAQARHRRAELLDALASARPHLAEARIWLHGDARRRPGRTTDFRASIADRAPFAARR